MLCIYICIYLHIWYLYIHTIIIKRWLDFPYCTNVYWISFEGLLSVFHLKECHPCQEKAAPKAAKATAEAKPKAAAADKKSATTAATPRAEAKVKAWRYHKPFGRNWGKNMVFFGFKNWILHEFESRHRQRRPSNFQTSSNFNISDCEAQASKPQIKRPEAAMGTNETGWTKQTVVEVDQWTLNWITRNYGKLMEVNMQGLNLQQLQCPFLQFFQLLFGLVKVQSQPTSGDSSHDFGKPQGNIHRSKKQSCSLSLMTMTVDGLHQELMLALSIYPSQSFR